MNGSGNNPDRIRIILVFIAFSFAIMGMCAVAVHSDLEGDVVAASPSVCIFNIDEHGSLESVSNVVSSYLDTDTLVIDNVAYRTCGEGVAEVLGFEGYPSTDLVIPRTVTSPDGGEYRVVRIADDAFRDMAIVESVVIPDTVTEAGRNAFGGCVSLTALVVPVTMGCHHGDDGYAFKDVFLEELTLTKGADGLPKEGNEFWSPMASTLRILVVDEGITSFTTTFGGSIHLESVMLKDVESIGEDQFRDCPSLRTVVAPKVRAVDDNAFMDCSRLNTVDLSSLVSLTGGIFVHCTSLRTVISDMLFIDDGRMFMILDDDNVALIQQIDADPIMIEIPAEVASPSGRNYAVTEIGKEAFRMQENLRILLINGDVGKVGEHAFLDCRSLKTISVPIGIDCAPYTGKSAFEGVEPLTLILTSEGYDPEKYMDNEFWMPFRHSLKNLVVGEGITDFRTSFEDTGLSNVVLSEVETVHDGQFEGCDDLLIASFPEAANVGRSAFKNCHSLMAVDAYETRNIGREAFSGCYVLYDFVGDSVEIIGEKGFYGCIPLSEFNFDNIKKVCSKAFYDTAVTNAPISKSYCFAKDSFGSSLDNTVKVGARTLSKEVRLQISTTLGTLSGLASLGSILKATEPKRMADRLYKIQNKIIPALNKKMIAYGNPAKNTDEFNELVDLNQKLIDKRLEERTLQQRVAMGVPAYWKYVAIVTVVATATFVTWSVVEWNTDT